MRWWYTMPSKHLAKVINKGVTILKVHKCCTPVNKAMSEISNWCHYFLSNPCKNLPISKRARLLTKQPHQVDGSVHKGGCNRYFIVEALRNKLPRENLWQQCGMLWWWGGVNRSSWYCDWGQTSRWSRTTWTCASNAVKKYTDEISNYLLFIEK